MKDKFVCLITVKDYEEFNKNYIEYMNTIRPFMSEEGKKENDEFVPNFQEDDNRWEYLIFNERNEHIGFIMIGLYPNTFSKHSVFVQQLYIKPEYQRNGYGFLTIEDITERFSRSDICLYILKKNKTAICFWNTTMRRLGFRDEFAFAGINTEKDNGETEFKYYSR